MGGWEKKERGYGCKLRGLPTSADVCVDYSVCVNLDDYVVVVKDRGDD